MNIFAFFDLWYIISMPKPSFEKNSNPRRWDKESHTFSKDISPKVNVRAKVRLFGLMAYQFLMVLFNVKSGL